MPFGVSSAPAIFQRAMDAILQGLPQVICYLDNILVTERYEEEHMQNLEEVLHCLKEHGIRLRRDKCQFFQEAVEYLGHVVDAQGIRTSPKKIQAITEAPSPRTYRIYAHS